MFDVLSCVVNTIDQATITTSVAHSRYYRIPALPTRSSADDSADDDKPCLRYWKEKRRCKSAISAEKPRMTHSSTAAQECQSVAVPYTLRVPPSQSTATHKALAARAGWPSEHAHNATQSGRLDQPQGQSVSGAANINAPLWCPVSLTSAHQLPEPLA